MHGKRGIRGHVTAAGWGQCKVSIYNSSFRLRGTSLAQFFIKHHVIPAACALKKNLQVPEKKPQCDNLQFLETGQELRRFSQAMCKKVIKPWEDGTFCLRGSWNKAAGPGDSGGPVFLQNAPRRPELGKLVQFSIFVATLNLKKNQ